MRLFLKFLSFISFGFCGSAFGITNFGGNQYGSIPQHFAKGSIKGRPMNAKELIQTLTEFRGTIGEYQSLYRSMIIPLNDSTGGVTIFQMIKAATTPYELAVVMSLIGFRSSDQFSGNEKILILKALSEVLPVLDGKQSRKPGQFRYEPDRSFVSHRSGSYINSGYLDRDDANFEFLFLLDLFRVDLDKVTLEQTDYFLNRMLSSESFSMRALNELANLSRFNRIKLSYQQFSKMIDLLPSGTQITFGYLLDPTVSIVHALVLEKGNLRVQEKAHLLLEILKKDRRKGIYDMSTYSDFFWTAYKAAVLDKSSGGEKAKLTALYYSAVAQRGALVLAEKMGIGFCQRAL